jgi:hypothetical protein
MCCATLCRLRSCDGLTSYPRSHTNCRKRFRKLAEKFSGKAKLRVEYNGPTQDLLHFKGNEMNTRLNQRTKMIWIEPQNLYRVNVQCFRVPHNNRYTLLLENISLYFVLQQVFELVTFLGYPCQQTPSQGHSCESQRPRRDCSAHLDNDVFTMAVYNQTSKWLSDDISGAHDGEYEDYYLLGCCAV